MAKSKKTSDAFDMADDIRKEVAAESVADACSTSVPAIYSLAKGDNPRRAKYDKNADVIGYNLRLPANIHRLLKRHCMETNESMNNVVLVLKKERNDFIYLRTFSYNYCLKSKGDGRRD